MSPRIFFPEPDMTSSIFAAVELAPRDPILGLNEAFNADPRTTKVNLGVGVYCDDNGKIPLLGAVRAAEKARLEAQPARGYQPIEGLASYNQAVQNLLFGADSALLKDGRVVTVEALGGTGALKVGADYLKRLLPAAKVYISDPSWENHRALFESAGFAVENYPYYDAASKGVNFAGMQACLAGLPAGTVLRVNPYDFDRLGVRVPAIAISSYTLPGTVVNAEMHHAAVIKTLLRMNPGPVTYLTERDRPDTVADLSVACNGERAPEEQRERRQLVVVEARRSDRRVRPPYLDVRRRGHPLDEVRCIVMHRFLDVDHPMVGGQPREELLRALIHEIPAQVREDKESGHHGVGSGGWKKMHAAAGDDPQPGLRGVQRGGGRRMQSAFQPVSGRMHWMDVPQPAAMPMRGIVPVAAVEDRIEAHAFDGHPGRDGRSDFVGDLGDPVGAPAADVAGLTDDERAAVALVHFGKQAAERQAARVARMPEQRARRGVRVFARPLVRVIPVDADEIEVRGAAAELRLEPAGEHVPGLKLMRAQ